MNKNKLPKFKSKEEAALFWENHELLDHLPEDEFEVVDPKKSKRFSFSPPRPVKHLISLRVNLEIIETARTEAEKQQVGYQTVLNQWLRKGLEVSRKKR